jgi:hypothetical protein
MLWFHERKGKKTLNKGKKWGVTSLFYATPKNKPRVLFFIVYHLRHIFVMITIMPLISTHMSPFIQNFKEKNNKTTPLGIYWFLWWLVLEETYEKWKNKCGLEYWMIDIMWELSLTALDGIEKKSMLSELSLYS